MLRWDLQLCTFLALERDKLFFLIMGEKMTRSTLQADWFHRTETVRLRFSTIIRDVTHWFTVWLTKAIWFQKLDETSWWLLEKSTVKFHQQNQVISKTASLAHCRFKRQKNGAAAGKILGEWRRLWCNEVHPTSQSEAMRILDRNTHFPNIFSQICFFFCKFTSLNLRFFFS